jgi:cytidine deaminase
MLKQPVSPRHQALMLAAKDAADHAYAPYSNFRVGAALECKDGYVVAGCNVENASYGLTICAERNAIAAAVATGHQEFNTIVVYTPLKKLVAPCGACRQVIAEFMHPDGEIVLANDVGDSQCWTVSELLPAAFTPAALKEK